MTALLCVAQDHDVLCRDGDGRFQATFRTGVTVEVRAARAGELATRACEATLSWGKDRLVVAANALQLDVDTFGVDLGLGVPVTTFQVKKSGNECCMEYQIYSLATSPRLLKTVTGGEYFSAGDTDLDGRIEIWTNDGAVVQGFEDLDRSDFDSAPTIVLRFVHGDLEDASSEFVTYFDRKIAEVQKELDSDGLRDFKSSDGKLAPTVASANRLQHLRGIKAKILEIVWGYLYSGREQQAWHALAELWPAADVARVHASILDARARGIRAQVNITSEARPARRHKRIQIFDAIEESVSGKLEVTPPSPIMLRRPALLESRNKDLPQSELLLLLVIDSAGKVRSAEPAGKAQSADPTLVRAVTGWKFIPAFGADRAVASRIRFAVSLRQ
jgi:hypothetical protein